MRKIIWEAATRLAGDHPDYRVLSRTEQSSRFCLSKCKFRVEPVVDPGVSPGVLHAERSGCVHRAVGAFARQVIGSSEKLKSAVRIHSMNHESTFVVLCVWSVLRLRARGDAIPRLKGWPAICSSSGQRSTS
jgi:hypothetical protein